MTKQELLDALVALAANCGRSLACQIQEASGSSEYGSEDDEAKIRTYITETLEIT